MKRSKKYSRKNNKRKTAPHTGCTYKTGDYYVEYIGGYNIKSIYGEKFAHALKLLFLFEHDNRFKALHKNIDEIDLTFMGIYKKFHPDWEGWKIIESHIEDHKFLFDQGTITKKDILRNTSSQLLNNDELLMLVSKFYKNKFWDIAMLDKIQSQRISSEIFIFGVNVGMRRAIMLAQKAVAVKEDGIVGPKSIRALNSIDEKVFDNVYDEYEKQYYIDLVEKYPEKKKYLNGWMKRAKKI